MDPLTQSLLGAAAAHSLFARKLGAWAIAIGAVAGELPDADVFLGAFADPALPFEIHRHFTHSLVFIPVGGLLAAAPFLLLAGLRRRAGAVCAAAIVACATHGPLDNCTSYGTHLLWPFVAHRTAWDVVAIIDPLFTLALAAGLAVALLRRSPVPSRVGFAIALLYLGLGFVQHSRAASAQRVLAESRGHDEVERSRVMPTLGNLIVWRSIYESGGVLHADAIRVPLFGAAAVRTGSSRPRFTVEDLPPEFADARNRDLFERFSAFATGFTAYAAGSGEAPLVGDVRYSFDAAGFEPIWGLRFDEDSAETRFVGGHASNPGGLEGLLRGLAREVLDEDGRFRDLPGQEASPD